MKYANIQLKDKKLSLSYQDLPADTKLKLEVVYPLEQPGGHPKMPTVKSTIAMITEVLCNLGQLQQKLVDEEDASFTPHLISGSIAELLHIADRIQKKDIPKADDGRFALQILQQGVGYWLAERPPTTTEEVKSTPTFEVTSDSGDYSVDATTGCVLSFNSHKLASAENHLTKIIKFDLKEWTRWQTVAGMGYPLSTLPGSTKDILNFGDWSVTTEGKIHYTAPVHDWRRRNCGWGEVFPANNQRILEELENLLFNLPGRELQTYGDYTVVPPSGSERFTDAELEQAVRVYEYIPEETVADRPTGPATVEDLNNILNRTKTNHGTDLTQA